MTQKRVRCATTAAQKKTPYLNDIETRIKESMEEIRRSESKNEKGKCFGARNKQIARELRRRKQTLRMEEKRH